MPKGMNIVMKDASGGHKVASRRSAQASECDCI